MTAVDSRTAENIHDLLDYQVLDQAGNEVGTLHSFWADHKAGALEFVGVKTGWLFGANHVLPVDRVEFDDSVWTDFKEEVIDVPLSREEVVVSKKARVTGAVHLNKTAATETQQVSETVRKEDVEVLRNGKTVTERDERTGR